MRQSFFFLMLCLGTDSGMSVRRVLLRESLLVLLRAPYRYKLARHQLSLSRQRIILDFEAGPSLSLPEDLASLGTALLSLAWVRTRAKGRSKKWLA